MLAEVVQMGLVLPSQKFAPVVSVFGQTKIFHATPCLGHMKAWTFIDLMCKNYACCLKEDALGRLVSCWRNIC